MWRQIHQFLLKTETFILVGLFLSLILISVTQIFMRNVLGSGLLWAESYMRVVVLWLALIGAMIASRQTEHINIDVFSKKLPASYARFNSLVINLFTAVVCLILTWYSIDFVVQEYLYGGTAFANIPIWMCEAIIPLASFIIALRYIAAIFIPQSK